MNDDGTLVGCESRIQFEVTGFRLHGHTHNLHSDVPTKGLEIRLLSSDGFVLKTVETDDSGDYTFSNVMSGEYILEASHGSWTLEEPSRQVISVGFGAVSVQTDFVVSGYRISGRLENESGSSSFDGVSLRFTRGDSVVKEITPEKDGSFVLSSVTNGVYDIIVVLLPGSPEWTIEPSKMRVSVNNDSVDLPESFVIKGFTLHGRVVDETGAPMKGVCIGIDSHVTSQCTGEDGTYFLPAMKERLYMIDVVFWDEFHLGTFGSFPLFI